MAAVGYTVSDFDQTTLGNGDVLAVQPALLIQSLQRHVNLHENEARRFLHRSTSTAEDHLHGIAVKQRRS